MCGGEVRAVGQGNEGMGGVGESGTRSGKWHRWRTGCGEIENGGTGRSQVAEPVGRTERWCVWGGRGSREGY